MGEDRRRLRAERVLVYSANVIGGSRLPNSDGGEGSDTIQDDGARDGGIRVSAARGQSGGAPGAGDLPIEHGGAAGQIECDDPRVPGGDGQAAGLRMAGAARREAGGYRDRFRRSGPD